VTPSHTTVITTNHRVDEIDAKARARMFELMCAQFENVDREQFNRDLDEKDDVFLVTTPDGQVQGFSTLVALETEVAGKPIVGLFSGDTIIDPGHWADRQFLRIVGQRLFARAAQWPDRTVYWLLLTCTFRSYRLLTAVYQDYAPRHDVATPSDTKADLDALVSLKFPREYHAEQGLVILEKPTPVRTERADIDTRHLNDVHVDYFVQANPCHARGDFLCCLTELVPSNLSPLGHRLFKL